MKKQTRKRYTPEYKLEAIALVNDHSFSINEELKKLPLSSALGQHNYGS